MKYTSSVETIGRDVPCCRCGYNLRGLAISGRCPECGEAVEISQAGRHLATSDPRWRRRLRLGAGLHACGLIGFVLLVIGQFSNPSPGPASIRDCVLMVVATSLASAGAWLTASSEPGGPYFDGARWLRRVIRGLAVLSWSGIVGYAAIQPLVNPRSFDQMALWQNITGPLGFGGSLLVTSLAIWHLSQLAKRMDAGRLVFYGRLAASSPTIMLGVIFGTGGLLAYFGVRDPLMWLGMLLYSMFFLWPATYQLIWCYRVGQQANKLMLA